MVKVEVIACDLPGCESRAEEMSAEEMHVAGWYTLDGPDGSWDYCSLQCLEAHL